MLWIALRLTKLPLEIFLRGMPTPEPMAVAEGHQIMDCDRKARLRGLHPGMGKATALALAPNLIIKARDPAGETEALLGLAGWATAYTPAVTLEFPDALLLEISGSLKLLGGLEIAVQEMSATIREMGFSAAIACAPTSRAAIWLVRSMDDGTQSMECAFADADGLKQALAALPLTAMKCHTDILCELQTMGAAQIGDLLALPRDGLARRFGSQLMNEVDCALGLRSEARSFFKPPAQFHAALEFPAEVSQTEALLFAARRLFVQLAGFLGARCAGVNDVTIKLAHRERTTSIAIGMVAPSRDATHFTLLLRERLVHLALPEPVRSISVSANDFIPLAGKNLSLIAQDAAGESRTHLIEKLRARLGVTAVQNIATLEDHRPEKSSVIHEMGAKQLAFNFCERPFWLLTEPLPLKEVDFKPHHNGPLKLLAGPERIDSGWWDGEAMRDYFIASAQDHSLLWIYRERRPVHNGRWYLHGIFA